MTVHPSVLIGLGASGLRDRLEGWIRRMGFEPSVTEDGRQTVAWVRERPFAASFLDSGLSASAGERVWRQVQAVLGRRLVLMTPRPRTDLWFEALRMGVGAVLPLPPEEVMVRAALQAVTGRAGPTHGERRFPAHRPQPQVDDSDGGFLDAQDQAAE